MYLSAFLLLCNDDLFCSGSAFGFKYRRGIIVVLLYVLFDVTVVGHRHLCLGCLLLQLRLSHCA